MSHQPPFPDTRGDTIAEFYELWLAMSDTGKPTLLQFDPRSLPSHLRNYWMVKVETGPLRFRFVYYGSTLTSVVGHDRTGELVPVHHKFHDLLSRTYETGKPGWRKAPSESETFNTKDIDIETISLPLFDEAGNSVTQIMGVARYFHSNGGPIDEESYDSHLL